MIQINKIKKSGKNIAISFALLLVLFALPFTASAAQEKRVMIKVGDTWEKDGWNISVKSIDTQGKPNFVMVSLSYLERTIGDTKIETGKSYTFKGRNPDGSEVPLFTIKDSGLFVGVETKAFSLDLNWSIPDKDVEIIDVPEVSDPVKPERPVPSPTAQASPEVPGFEVFVGIIGILVVWLGLKK
ncbi:Uncharacterised protein [uncultured archaeon]|nr:Uncharacterised protein [uncultured archaeon]